MESGIEMQSLDTDAKVVANETAENPQFDNDATISMLPADVSMPFALQNQATKEQRKIRHEENKKMASYFKEHLERRERFLIRRSNLFNKVWDSTILFTTLVLLVAIPMKWSFFSGALIPPCISGGVSFTDTAQNEFKALQAVSFLIISICTAILIIDICMTFFTPYIDKILSHEVVRLDRIALHYLKFDFWKDAMAAFPWSLCFYKDSTAQSDCEYDKDSSSDAITLKLIQILMLLGCPFLTRRFLKELRRCATHWQLSYESFEAFRAVAMFIILLNFMACIWNYLGEIEESSAHTEKSWSTNYLGDTLRYNGIHGFISYYCSAFYYASMTCTTIGYGDVTAQTSVERMFSSLFMIIGAAFYGYAVGVTVTVVESRGEANKEYFQGVDTMNEIMKIKHTPKRISRAILHYLDNSRSLREEIEQAEFMANLSPVLRAKMCECMYGESIRKIRCFKNAPADFVGQLGAMLQPQAFSANETLIRRHEISGQVSSRDGPMVLCSCD